MVIIKIGHRGYADMEVLLKPPELFLFAVGQWRSSDRLHKMHQLGFCQRLVNKDTRNVVCRMERIN